MPESVAVWKIVVDDHEYSKEDLTVGEAMKIEDLTGERWWAMQPLQSARHLAAYIAVFSARTGQSVDEVFTRVSGMKVDDALEYVKVEEDAAGPLDGKKSPSPTVT